MRTAAIVFCVTALLATQALAQSSTTPSNPAMGGGNLPASGTQNGMGSPTGTGIGTEGNSTLVAPGGGGNGFQNNSSLNGSSSSGTPGIGGAAPGTTP